MSSATRIEVPPRLAVLAMLAALLEKLERGPVPVQADQYRSVAQRLAAELAAVEPDVALGELLKVFPAASELYENLRYAHAGLCRSPLEPSLKAEMAVRDLLSKILR